MQDNANPSEVVEDGYSGFMVKLESNSPYFKQTSDMILRKYPHDVVSLSLSQRDQVRGLEATKVVEWFSRELMSHKREHILDLIKRLEVCE